MVQDGFIRLIKIAILIPVNPRSSAYRIPMSIINDHREGYYLTSFNRCNLTGIVTVQIFIVGSVIDTRKFYVGYRNVVGFAGICSSTVGIIVLNNLNIAILYDHIQTVVVGSG